MEVVNNWRLKHFRCGLIVNLDAKNNTLGNIPQGIKEHVEKQNYEKAYGLMAISVMSQNEEALS